tara:strand:+ start:3121 stop:5592 length:2472 start_codon:yes stop_codon:yes gene_type:complete
MADETPKQGRDEQGRFLPKQPPQPPPPPQPAPSPPKEKEKEDKKASMGIAKMTGQMIGLTVAMAGAKAVISLATSPLKALTSLPGLAKKIVSGFGGLVKAFSGLDISLANVGKAFSSGLSTADALQEQALGMGKTLGGFQTAFADSIGEMPGILSQRLGTTMTMFDSGLRGNTKSVAKLTQMQKMTGRDFKGLIASLEGLQTQMGLTNAGLDSVAEATIRAQLTYGVNAEKIVGAMNALSQQTKDAALLDDLSPMMAGAIAEISGELGGRGKQQIAEAMDALMGGIDSYSESAKLNILAAREAMNNATTSSEFAEAFRQAVKGANAEIKMWGSGLDGFNDAGLKASIMTGQIGKSVTAFKRLDDLMNVEMTSSQKLMAMGMNMMSTLKQQALALWEPIANLWLEEGAKLYEMIVANATEIGNAFRAYIVEPIKMIVKGFTESMLENGNLMDGIKTIFRAVGKVFLWVANTLGKEFGDGGSMYDKVVNFFSGVLLNIANGLDDFLLKSLPTIELAFLTVASTILKALSYVMDVDQNTIDELDKRAGETRMGMMTDKQIAALSAGVLEGTEKEAEGMSGWEIAGMVTAGVVAAGAVVLTAGAAAPLVAAAAGTVLSTGALATTAAVASTVVGVTAIGTGIAAGVGAHKVLSIGKKEGGEAGKFYVTHPISGVEEVFNNREAALTRQQKIQDELAAAVKGRQGKKTLSETVAAGQDALLGKQNSKLDDQLDLLADIVDSTKATAKNTEPEPEALEVVPGTHFQDSLGNMLSESILHVLREANEQANERMLNVQERIFDQLVSQGLDIGISAEVAQSMSSVRGAAGE